MIRARFKKFTLEFILTKINGNWVNLPFQQVLEKMRTQRRLIGNTHRAAGKLHQGFGIVNIAIIHMHA